MSHPFGDLISRYLHRKHGLSQAQLAAGIDQPASVIGLMCRGQRLTGTHARERVVAIISWLFEHQVLTNRADADALLAAAGMAQLNPGDPIEAGLLRRLSNPDPASTPLPATLVDPAAGRIRISPRSRLPQPLTGFIGRQEVLAEVVDLLALPATRLLTLVGAGGCGKTRLALQIAHQLESVYPDSLWWVDLAALADAHMVPQTVATALGIREQAGEMIQASLIEHLLGRKALLILDNCEHLVATCARLSETLLYACPNLQILATSREELRSAGEVIYHVPSLSLPPDAGPAVRARLSSRTAHLSPPGSLEPAALLRFEAVRLFLERASAVSPGFTLTTDRAPAVIQICRRLDGIPLAIELAATRVKLLTIEQIANSLDDCFRILAGGRRTALPRQQTMRATIGWSYDLLKEPERVLLRRLAVFAGNFTLTAVEAICSGHGIETIETNDALELLGFLIDKSLVLVETHQSYEQRYRLLETVRQYAHERLEEAGETGQLSTAHLQWYLELAELARTGLAGSGQLAWLDCIDHELDNLRAALAWALATDPAAELQIASALWHYWMVRGDMSEGRSWLEQGLARGSGVPATIRARALLEAGKLASFTGDYAGAVALHEQGLAPADESGDRACLIELLGRLGNENMIQGDHQRAEFYLARGRALADESGNRESLAFMLRHQAGIAYCQDRLQDAWGYLLEALALEREMGNTVLVATLLMYLGIVTSRLGDYSQAHAYFSESLRIQRDIGFMGGIAACLEGFAGLCLAGGRVKQAVCLLSAGQAIRDAIADPRSFIFGIFERIDFERNLAAARAQLSVPEFAAAWAAGQAMPLDEAIASGLAASTVAS